MARHGRVATTSGVRPGAPTGSLPSHPNETLIDANFAGADLRKANMNGADLRRANLQGADLSLAYL
ncbi:MAG: pentapeptide repeat-containing protein, partial [Candidatus Poribacteria bacterium]